MYIKKVHCASRLFQSKHGNWNTRFLQFLLILSTQTNKQTNHKVWISSLEANSNESSLVLLMTRQSSGLCQAINGTCQRFA